MPYVNKAKNMTWDVSCIAARSCGLTVEQYYYESDVTPRIHLITKPFFFLCSLDDYFFGPYCIP